MFLLYPYEDMSSHFETANGSFLTFCQMVLLPNINFLVSKQNKTPNKLIKNVKAVCWYCYSQTCFCSNSNDILNKFSQLLCTWFQYLYISSKNSELHLNSHYEFGNICIRILTGILQFLPLFNLGNRIFRTKTDTNLLHKHDKYEHFFS